MQRPILIPLLLAAAVAGALASVAAASSAAEPAGAVPQAQRKTIVVAHPDGHPAPLAQRVKRPLLGVIIDADDDAGVRVLAVTPDGGAAKAGLRSGDRLLSIDGSAIDGADQDARLAKARTLLGKLQTERAAQLRYRRDGRDATVAVVPQLGNRVVVLDRADGAGPGPRREVRIHRIGDGETFEFHDAGFDFDFDAAVAPAVAAAVAPQVRSEVIRLSRNDRCKGGDCKWPAISEALRWNGLNLASVDAKLGRYFGAQRGVLVLSTGPELAGLEAGDVIQSIDGRRVDTPRQAMEALRGKSEGSQVAVDYLRDRRNAQTQLKVPKAINWTPPRPPAPPAPPAPPSAPDLPPPPAPPAPPSASDLPAPPTPPAPPAPPKRSASARSPAMAFAPPAPPAPPVPPSWADSARIHAVY